MKVYTSRKSPLLAILILGMLSIPVVAFILSLQNQQAWSSNDFMLLLLVLIPAIIFLGWIWWGTYYQINDSFLRYKCGPYKGSVDISSIQSIKKAWFPVMGTRASLSFQCLKINYNEREVLFISPKNQSELVEYMQSVNQDIQLFK